MLEHFVPFSTMRDRRRKLQPADKVVNYIEYDRGKKIPDRERKGNETVNNFHIENVEQLNVMG